jgi:hypothetical protein
VKLLNFGKLFEEVYPQLRLPTFISWSEEIDASTMKLSFRVGRLLAKRVSPLTPKHPVDAVEELRKNGGMLR